jgi:hypothetical protein
MTQGLQLLTKAFKLDELRTGDIAHHFVKPVTEVPSTNFVHALVDGDLDFEGLPNDVLPKLSVSLRQGLLEYLHIGMARPTHVATEQ